jgi:DNA-binding NarL/FixJ family response regulator
MRVVVAEDSFLMRAGVVRVLEETGFTVVGEASDADQLLAQVREHRPDVVVTDIRMPPSDSDEGLQVADELRRTHPDVGVVVLSQYSDPRYGLRLLQGGSDRRAYLLKERIQHRSQLVTAIETVADGGSVMDAKVVEALMSARTHGERSALRELTPRELETIAYVARGHSNQAIADELVLTKRAVEKHINAIFLKLGLAESQDVSRRVKAVLIYLAETGSH